MCYDIIGEYYRKVLWWCFYVFGIKLMNSALIIQKEFKRRKIMKKTIVSLFLAIMVVISCCACNSTTVTTDTESWVEGGNSTTIDSSSVSGDNSGNGSGSNTGSNTGSNSSQGSSSNSKIENPLDVDLKGATITVYQGDAAFSSFLVSEQNTKTRKNYQEILDTVQKKLNCKIVVKSVTEEKLRSQITASAASGKALCNIATTRMTNLGYYISAGVLADMTRLSSMDLSKDYMNRLNMLNASELGGAKYAVCSEDGRRAWVTLYNKRILKELGYEDDYLYNLVDSKKWNYTNCRNIGKKAMKDLDGKSGMSEADQWGFLFTDHSVMTSNAILNNGGALVKHNQDGYLSYNMLDDKVVSAVSLMSDFYLKDGTVCRLISNWQDRQAAFATGHSLFSFQTLEHVASVSSNMSDEFGLLPIPMMDGSSNYNSVLDWNADAITILAGQSSKEQYNSGAVIQALLSLCDKNADVYQKEMATRYLCDDESAKNMKIAIGFCKANVEAVYGNTNETILSGTYRPFWNCVEGGKSFVTACEETKSATVKALDELNATAKKNKS